MGRYAQAATRVTRTLGVAEAGIGVALACNTAWVPMNFKSMGIYANFGHGENLLDSIYLISIIAVAATLFLAGMFNNVTRLMLERRATYVAVALGTTTSTLAMPLTGVEGWVGICALVVGGTTSGLFSGVLLVYFGMAFSELPTRSAVVAGAIGFTLATFLFALSCLFSPLEACLFSASMPLAGAFLLSFGMATSRKGAAKSRHVVAIPAQSAPADPQEHHDLRHLVFALALSSFLVGFANEAARTLYVQMGIAGAGGRLYAIAQAFCAFGVTVGAVLIMLALLNSANHLIPTYCYRTLMIFLVAGALLLPAPILYPDGGAIMPHSLNAAAYQCFGFLMWVVVSGICNKYATSRVRTFCFVRAAWALGPLAGMLLGRYVLHNLGLSGQSVFPVLLVSVTTLLVAFGFMFTETDLASAINVIPTERRRRFVERCNHVIAQHGLSEREGEIMTMFAKGRNLAYIQEQLCLSKSTVSTHRQHIYQKLDIHSQQELIDLMQKSGND